MVYLMGSKMNKKYGMRSLLAVFIGIILLLFLLYYMANEKAS